MATKKFTLGRGLDALISTEAIRTSGSSSIGEISLSRIEANPNQPRREFSEESLRELADSIREIGIVQPITLRQIDDERYQIIAGERRFRASQLAGKDTIPAYIITANDENTMEMALVENIQREDLNALEIALAYQKLIEQNNLSQEQLRTCHHCQFPATTKVACPRTNGIEREANRHGARTCTALTR